jgi:membrane-associated protein
VDIGLNPLDAKDLVSTLGLIGVLAIVFAETGLLIGFFLPGDSLLFAAGLFAANGKLSLTALLIGTPIAAIVGAQVGYAIGRASGPRLFSKPDSRFFRHEYIERARHHLERFGAAKAIVLARFIPIVRTMLNPVAGVLHVPHRMFTLWNIVGGAVWTVGVTLAGYWAGEKIPSIDRYLLPLVVVIVALSAIPIALEVRRARAASDDR